MRQINLKSIKTQNISSVFSVISAHNGISRNDIAQETNLSLMTVGKIVDILAQNDAVIEIKDNDPGKVGRKVSCVSINQKAKSVAIIDLSGRNIKLSLLSIDLTDIGTPVKRLYNTNKSYEENLKDALDNFSQLLFDNQTKKSLIGIGVIVPGPYCPEKDCVINKRISELSQIKLKSLMCKYFPGLSIFIDEDVKYAVRYNAKLVENYHKKTIFYGYIGEGVGGVVVVNGNLLLGKNSVAGDFGQMRFSDSLTLEQKLTGPANSESLPDRVKPLAEALYNICWIINPHVIIIQSDYVKSLPGFTDSIRESLNAMLSNQDCPEIIFLEEHQYGVCKGAAIAIVEKWIASL